MNGAGHDLATEPGVVRLQLGVCPQQDVLFEQLTCLEHLHMFQGIKGNGGAAPNDSDSAGLEELLRMLGLEDKRNGVASELSGGQKRKLSLAIAMVGRIRGSGHSKVLVLDE